MSVSDEHRLVAAVKLTDAVFWRHPLSSASRPAKPTFTEGDMSGHVVRLSGFMVMGFLAMTLAMLAEAVYLGMLGRAELAAVAFTFPVVMAFNALARGIGIGTGAVLARAIGEGDRDRSARLATHGLLLTLGFTLLCTGLMLWNGQAVIESLGAKGPILELAATYTGIWCLGFPAFGVSMVGSGLMRSIGDPAFPGYVMTAGSLLQILFGPVLIFGWFGLPALGIEGAAWSFVLARGTAFGMVVWWFLVREKMIRWSLVGVGQSARDILHVGLPAAATNLIGPLSLAATTRILASLGTTVVAGFGVASRIDSVVTMVVVGIAASAGPLVGQNWGAKLYDRVDEALRLGYRYSLLWGVIAACLMWVGGEYFVGLVTDDGELAMTAKHYLYIVPITIGFMGMMNVATASFNALSKPGPPLVLSLTRVVLVYVPAAIVASHYFGELGVFVVLAAVNVLFGLVGWQWSKRVIASMRLQPTPST